MTTFDESVLLEMDPVEGLATVWNEKSISLGAKARLVSRLRMKSRLSLEGAARVCSASPVEVQALSELATLDDDDLALVSQVNAPATTWLLFAGADSDAIRAGVAALESAPEGSPVLSLVYSAMKETLGPDLDERVASVSGATLSQMARKAKEYGKLNDWQKKFLASVATQKKTGKPLTQNQVVKLREALLDLVEAGVVRRDSPDGDQPSCDEVLDALHM